MVDTRPASIERAAALLRAGGLVAFPTETVYGLGAAVDRPDALRRVFVAKARPTADPLIVHVADAAAARAFAGEWPDAAAQLAERCWPGPLTLVVRRPPGLDDLVCAGGSTVGVRVPEPTATRELLALVGAPVAAPSANRFGRISPTTAAHVLEEFSGADVADRPDLILDGGPCALGVESTVVDVTGPVPVVLRPGGVGVEDLERWLGPVEVRHRADRQPDDRADDAPDDVPDDVTVHRSPGEFVGHYAPSSPVVALDAPRGTAARLADRATRPGRVVVALDLPDEPDRAAHVLYGRLRALDEHAPDLIVAELVPPTGIGRAVNDRLRRAAHGRLVVCGADQSIQQVVASVLDLLED